MLPPQWKHLIRDEFGIQLHHHALQRSFLAFPGRATQEHAIFKRVKGVACHGLRFAHSVDGPHHRGRLLFCNRVAIGRYFRGAKGDDKSYGKTKGPISAHMRMPTIGPTQLLSA